MRKIYKSLFSLVLFLMMVSLAYASCPTGKEPQIGHTFKGIATYSGSALASKTVTATVGDNEVSTTTDSSGNYQIVAVKCGVTGSDTVSFTVCTKDATENGTFSVGAKTEQDLTITSACPTVAPTGGGGAGAAGGVGAGAAAAVPSKINLDIKPTFSTVGYTASQTQGDTATFTVDGKKYTAELTQLRDDSVTITVAGQSAVLGIGDTVEFDVDGDGVNDISVTLQGIEGGRAEVLYKLLAAPEKPVEEVPEVEEEKEKVIPPKKLSLVGRAFGILGEMVGEPIGWIIILIIVVGGLIVYFAISKKKKPETPV